MTVDSRDVILAYLASPDASCEGLRQQLAMHRDVFAQAGDTEPAPLMLAITLERPEFVEMLLAAGDDPDYRTWRDLTPLHICMRGHLTHQTTSHMFKLPAGEQSSTERRMAVLKQLLSATEEGVDVVDYDGMSALHHAACHGLDEYVPALLDAGADPEMADCHGNLPLHWAIRAEGFDDADIMRLVTKESLRARNNDNYSPLYLAVYHNRATLVELLLAQGAMLKEDCDSHNFVPLVHAAELREPEMLKLLLSVPDNRLQEQDVAARALCAAARAGRVHAVQTLLEAGVNIDCSTLGGTPLHHAIKYMRTGVIDLLLAQGASPSQSDIHKCTILGSAMQLGEADHIRKLLSYGADPGPALHDALTRVSVKEVDSLLEAGASPNSFRENGRPIGLSIYTNTERDRFSDRREILEKLLEHGLNPDCSNEKGYSLLHRLCAARGSHEDMAILFRYGAHANVTDQDGRTPLITYLAPSKSNPGLRPYPSGVKTLLEAGADVTLQDNDGCTPLHVLMVLMAEMYERNICSQAKDIAALLLDAGVNPNTKDNNGRTPLALLILTVSGCGPIQGWRELGQALLDGGADPAQLPPEPFYAAWMSRLWARPGARQTEAPDTDRGRAVGRIQT